MEAHIVSRVLYERVDTIGRGSDVCVLRCVACRHGSEFGFERIGPIAFGIFDLTFDITFEYSETEYHTQYCVTHSQSIVCVVTGVYVTSRDHIADSRSR